MFNVQNMPCMYNQNLYHQCILIQVHVRHLQFEPNGAKFISIRYHNLHLSSNRRSYNLSDFGLLTGLETEVIRIISASKI